jgi:hypothetical protein
MFKVSSLMMGIRIWNQVANNVSNLGRHVYEPVEEC